VAVLSREEFDAIEFDAAASGDHRAAATRMSILAATGIQSDSMPRAEAYLRAGEQWLLADDPAAAASGFRRAIAEGGPVFVDPRVPLARALVQLGRSSEAFALISHLRHEGRSDPRACDLIAELLVDCGRLREALDWATVGVELCLAQPHADGEAAGPVPVPAARSATGQQETSAGLPGQAGQPELAGLAGVDENELRLLLRLRYRIRIDLGLPEDGYDKLLDELCLASQARGARTWLTSHCQADRGTAMARLPARPPVR
jgi:hypothetical protein